MAFNQNIPQPTDRLKDSQSDLLGNFGAIKDLIDVNHETFGDPDEGKHSWVSLPIKADPVAPTISGSNIAIYAKNDPTTTRTELYYKQATGGNVFNITGGQRAVTGWSYLSQNIITAWGSSSGSGDVVVTPSQVTFGKIYSVQITTWLEGSSPADKLARLKEIATSGNTFTVFCSNLSGDAASTGFQWMAIGVR